MSIATSPTFLAWLAGLEAHHLADLRVAEVTRALRALSSAYVERRHKVAAGATLDSAGKRAAFALYYAPLHLMVTHHVVGQLRLDAPAPPRILDLGCGTGAAGAAWAIAAGGTSAITGIDRHPWAVDEARRTYKALGLSGNARPGDLSRLPVAGSGDGIVAAYVLNEMTDAARGSVLEALHAAAVGGARALIIEPIARSIAPWWDNAAATIRAAGGRADEWRIPLDLPPLLRLFDKAAGLNHREVKVRTLLLERSAPPPRG